jgi:hypothetical protein
VAFFEVTAPFRLSTEAVKASTCCSTVTGGAP